MIASSDSDFTPLLQRLRASDRRTVIMSSDSTSPAYRSVAHAVLDAEDVVALLTTTDIAHDETAIESGDPSAETTATSRSAAERAIVEMIRASDEPVHLASLGLEVRRVVDGAVVEATKWFGHGTLGGFVRVAADGAFDTEGHLAWETGRHERPVVEPKHDIQLPPVIEELCKVTDLPRMGSATWPAVLHKLIEYASVHEFNLTESTAWVRDELADTETPVGRQPVGFVVRALAIGGASLSGVVVPRLDQCIEAVISSISDRAASTGWELDDHEVLILRRWLSGEGSEGESTQFPPQVAETRAEETRVLGQDVSDS